MSADLSTMIITIDGPAGAGKSSVARMLASRLGFEFLDTGAMYRAVTLAALQAAIPQGDESALHRLLAGLMLQMLPGGQVLLQGEDVSEQIRTREVTQATGWIASNPHVRQHLVELQRDFARERDVISEGRDQGTVVFPDASFKFFLIADPRERALRRQREMIRRGERVDLAEILRDQELRDARDAARAMGPLKPAADAIVIDSTSFKLTEVVDQLEQVVRSRMSPLSP